MLDALGVVAYSRVRQTKVLAKVLAKVQLEPKNQTDLRTAIARSDVVPSQNSRVEAALPVALALV